MAARCARTRPSAACGSSATCRSTSRRTAPTTARTRSSSSTARSRACRPTCSPPTGQLWGNPLYDWAAMRADGYRWWIERLRRDVRARRPDARRPLPRLRLLLGGPERKHDGGARALAPRPGRELFRGARAPRSAPLPVVAEDLGVITEPVVRLRRELGLPGHGRAPVRARTTTRRTRTCLENHEEQSVVYTGTHDNDTTLGWWESLSERRARVDGARPGRPGVVADRAARGRSRAALAIAPLQDVLGLGSEARMNLPGHRARATGSGATRRSELTAGARSATCRELSARQDARPASI